MQCQHILTLCGKLALIPTLIGHLHLLDFVSQKLSIHHSMNAGFAFEPKAVGTESIKYKRHVSTH